MGTFGCVMSLSTKVAGTWKDVNLVSTKVDGVWKTVSGGWIKVAGVWKQFYAGLGAVLTGFLRGTEYILVSGPYYSAGISLSVDVNGVGPFTYQWYYTGMPTTTSATTNPTFTMTLTDWVEASATGLVWCVVSDTFGNTASTEQESWSLNIVSLE